MTRSLEAAMADFAPQLPLAVAYSGGADSSALLHACAQRWPGQVYALHVHHGLQAAADDFAAHCQASCAQLGVELHQRRVAAQAQPGQSPEDAARRARYRALQAMAQQAGAPSLALAQHADDQVETLLLALSRGAGLPGLAAMPAYWQRAGLHWHRPLLTVAGADIRHWLQARGGAWVEDPSNGDTRYTRNHIRQRLLPALQQVFPGFRDTFARSSAHAGQADVLLRELAEADLQQIGVPPQIRALQQLSSARQANVLRYWLRSNHACTPTAAQLQELLRQIACCTTRGQRIQIKVGDGVVVREDWSLNWYNAPVLDFTFARNAGAPKPS